MKDDIIRMAREAGIKNDCDGIWCNADQLRRFANLVAAAEREEIAKLADASVNADQYPTLTMLAQAIRMRGDSDQLRRFANLAVAHKIEVALAEAAAAAEREACAKVCEGRLQEGLNFEGCAAAIRARGTT